MELPNGKNNFVDYLHLEYTYVAEAHFKTIETISSFFKHYVAIMAVPAALLGYLLATADKNPQLLQSLKQLTPLAAIFLIAIAIAGSAVMVYILNLRADVILYARTINGIRKFFYDDANIDINAKLRMRTLPQSTFSPAYYEKSYFLPVVLSFAVFNSFYFIVGTIFLKKTGALSDILGLNVTLTHPDEMIRILGVLFFLGHFLIYALVARYREYGYLKSKIIGVDIDGVLNKHRDHFCQILREKTNKEIQPSQITHIPVNETDLGITEDDEKSVFNDPRYWINMPAAEEIKKNLDRLRNMFKFKVMIFTYRPWPKTERLDTAQRDKVIQDWLACLTNLEKSVGVQHRPKLFLYRNNIINRITQLWLKFHGIKYDKLVIEKGHEDSTDPRGHFRNRFQISGRKRIRFFIEDDLDKAIKLSYICDVVLLIEHPYNQAIQNNRAIQNIPSNIVRVQSWNEIYRTIRKLS